MYLRPTRKRRLRTRTFVILISAIAATAVVLLFVFGVIPTPSFGNNNINTVDTLLPDNITASTNGLLYSQDNNLVLITEDGEEIWTVEQSIPGAVTESSDSLICNYQGTSLQVMLYNSEQLYSTAVEDTISDIAVGDEYVAALTTATDASETGLYKIHLFNETGTQTGQLSFDNRLVVDFGFFSDTTLTDLFWALSIDVSGVTPVSHISIFNKETGTMTSNITIPSKIVEKVFVTSNQIFASGTDYLTAYTYFGDTQSEQMIYDWYPMAQSATDTAVKLAYVPRFATDSIDVARLFYIDEQSDSAADFSVFKVNLSPDVFYVAISQTNFYAFSPTEFSSYSLDGTLEHTQEFDSEITTVKQLSDDYVAMWDTQNSYIIHLN